MGRRRGEEERISKKNIIERKRKDIEEGNEERDGRGIRRKLRRRKGGNKQETEKVRSG